MRSWKYAKNAKAGETRFASLGCAAVPGGWCHSFHLAKWGICSVADSCRKSCVGEACAANIGPDVRMVLNPYSSYEEMITICRMVLEKDPRVVCQRDGFKLTPLEPHLPWLLMCTLQKPFTRQQPDAMVGQSR